MKSPIIIPSTEPFFFPGNRIGCLLVHGFTGTPKEMRWLGEHLAECGFSVLGVRLFAHATRPDDMIRARWRDWIASVEDGWNLLSGCCDEIVIMGLSMGGILSLKFAADFPVAGLVIMATPHHIPADPRAPFIKVISLFKPYLPKGESNWVDQEAYNQHISYPVDPTRAYVEVRDLMCEMQDSLPQIVAPTLLIYSKNDQTVEIKERHADLIFNALGSQNKDILWIENSSHVITSDAQRELVFKAASQFVNHVCQGAA